MKSYLTHHIGSRVFAVPSLYNDSTTALILTDKEGERVATASVNMANELTIPWDQILVKDFNENEGMLKTLVEGGIVETTGFVHQNGGNVHLVWLKNKKILRDLRKLRKQYVSK